MLQLPNDYNSKSVRLFIQPGENLQFQWKYSISLEGKFIESDITSVVV